jgi:murein DD-endopeptidase MepM/ murein hydrolase activator NlpD
MHHKEALIILVVSMLSFHSISQAETNNDIQCRAIYPEQIKSQYVLPYMPGAEFLVGQGNCTDGSHEINTDQAFAYDFDMPIGTDIVASRDGTVVVIVEHYMENNNTPGQENYLVIEHDDGSISAYYHLTKDGVNVEVGDTVNQGEIIAKSGNTGDSSEPHLHFEVAVCEDCQTLPINFKNTSNHSNGLLEGKIYRAYRQ